MCRFKKEVNHGGSEGLTLICLLGIHSLAIELMAVFMLSASVAELQRRFTWNSSPMNCSLILEEVVREYKDTRQHLFVAFLDAKSAFYVVSHSSLLRKLFHFGIGGAEWSLVHSLHEGAESVVKWEGSISDVFYGQQGVCQGGILSTGLYKLYIDGLLDILSSLGDGCFV